MVAVKGRVFTSGEKLWVETQGASAALKKDFRHLTALVPSSSLSLNVLQPVMSC